MTNDAEDVDVDNHNSPGRRPNGVYDRFPLGGFTLLYGSLLGSPPPSDGISGLGDQMDQTVISSPKNTFFEFLTFVNFWSTFGTPNRIDIFQFWIDFRTLPCPISSILGSQRGPGEVLFGYVLGPFFLDRILDRFVLKKTKNEKMEKWLSIRKIRCFVKVDASQKSEEMWKITTKKTTFFLTTIRLN